MLERIEYEESEMSLEELYKLASDRPQASIEMHGPNDFYGNATILKQYAKYPPSYQIKGSIEHGTYLKDWVWINDIQAPLPAVMTSSRFRLDILKTKTNKALFPIGQMLYYAPQSMSEAERNKEKLRLGKNLLVFAGHSTHWIDLNYDIDRFCKFIGEFGKGFDSVRICLYWKDVLRGHAEQYLKNGFECVTAGHIFDPLFLPRLKSMIDLATHTVSNINGTHIALCTLMGKPHYFREMKLEHKAESEEILKRDGAIVNAQTMAIRKEILDAFSEPTDAITHSQKEIVEKYWGISEHKTVEEMQMIFQATEDMYRKGPQFFMTGRDVLADQAFGYLNEGKPKEGLFLLENATKIKPEIPELHFAKAVALAQMGQREKAVETVKYVLSVKPEFEHARTLLNEIERINSAVGNNLSTFNYGKNFFGPVILNSGTLAKIAADTVTWQEVLQFHSTLATDEYVKYLDTFYRECIKRFGSNWYYLDIVNVLYAASKTIQPRNYLEIGVRRGRSVCTVARGCPNVDILAFDMWMQGYAGMENPGPEFVKGELKKQGHTGEIYFINGNSHQTVPAFFKQNPQAMFDMITVDGDHSEEGALNDLKNVIPHLSVGGILAFDDIAHPAHLYLLNVWKRAMAMFPSLTSFEFTELGYGVAFAIRMG